MERKTAPVYCLESIGITTQRQFRRYKRAHLRAVRKAIDQMRLGCAFAPYGADGSRFDALDDLLKQFEESWSPMNWGA